MPGYRIPSTERVLKALREVLGKRRTVSSQKELKELLDRTMARDGGFRVSGPRARRIAYDSGLAKMEIEFRETHELKSLFKCPVCGHRLKLIKNMTVFGGTVTLGYKCQHCPYWTGIRRRVPARYIFTRASG
ncbi:MAG: hypothetical protein LN412_07665 [Candidatus Thermoplasmatota archaeon]|nr:hypothetical protein [Candidatus Thermoplasmatota archaeon]